MKSTKSLNYRNCSSLNFHAGYANGKRDRCRLAVIGLEWFRAQASLIAAVVEVNFFDTGKYRDRLGLVKNKYRGRMLGQALLPILRDNKIQNCSIIPPPRTFSPSYHTAACPGVILNCGSSNTIRTREFSRGITVTGVGVHR